MPHNVASDLGLHFLPNTPLGVSSIKRVKIERNCASSEYQIRNRCYEGHPRSLANAVVTSQKVELG